MTAIGLNYADIFAVLGLYAAANEVLASDGARGGGGGADARAPPPTAGAAALGATRGAGLCCGLEFAGVVTECGGAGGEAAGGDPDAPPLRVGDRVFGFTRFGAFANEVVPCGGTSPSHFLVDDKLLPSG